MGGRRIFALPDECKEKPIVFPSLSLFEGPAKNVCAKSGHNTCARFGGADEEQARSAELDFAGNLAGAAGSLADRAQVKALFREGLDVVDQDRLRAV